jgi:hypothetical protein
MSEVAKIDTLRSLGESSISSSYAAVGSVITHPIRILCITNNTDGDMIFSDDGVNDKLFVAKSSFKLFDIATNKDDRGESFALTSQTQMYVKYSTSPSTGSVYVEVIYGL